MTLKKAFSCLALTILMTQSALAGVITQEFEDSWTVALGDYWGSEYAIAWQYQDYELAPTTVTSVELELFFTVSGYEVGDDLNFRLSFFTGWTPSEYQFYSDQTISNLSGSKTYFGATYLFNDAEDLERWSSSAFGASGNQYFESTTFNGSHSISARTTLVYNYTEVPEPSSILLLGLGVIGLAFARKSRG